MKILLAGSNELADAIAEYLLQLEWATLVGVVGSAGAVGARAKAAKIPAYSPSKVVRSGADILIAAEAPAAHHAAWAKSARLGGLHVHLSLLPDHTGTDPVRWSILDGDAECGVTLHYITAEPYGGNVLAQEREEIKGTHDAAELEEAMRGLARDKLVMVLHALDKINALPGTPQKGSSRRDHDAPPPPERARLDFTRPMAEVHRQVAAFCHPYGGARCRLGGKPLAIWKAVPLPEKPNPKISQDTFTARDFKGPKEPGALVDGPEGARGVRCGCGGIMHLIALQLEPDEGGHRPAGVELLTGVTALESA